MNRGRVEEAGIAGEVLSHPSSAYTRTLLAAVPRIAMPSVAVAVAT
jgi:peptide/nickel transport system ATP-binding protein